MGHSTMLRGVSNTNSIPHGAYNNRPKLQPTVYCSIPMTVTLSTRPSLSVALYSFPHIQQIQNEDVQERAVPRHTDPTENIRSKYADRNQ